MVKGKTVKSNIIQKFENEDIGEFLATQPEIKFEIDIKRKTHLISVNEDVLEILTAIAKNKKMSSSELINRWLKEKIKENIT